MVTVWTGVPSMPGVDPDVEAEQRFLKDHPNVFIDPQGDGSVTAKVHVDANSQAEAEDEARHLVEEAMKAAGRTVLPEEISSDTAASEGIPIAPGPDGASFN